MKVIKRKPYTSHWYRPFHLDTFVGNDFVNNTPAVNVLEDNDNFRIEVAAPGYQKEDFSISLEDNVLTLATEKSNEKEETTEKFKRKEFSYSSFKRSFSLPRTVEPNNISANYQNGILNITIPKKEEAKSINKSIEIQ